jgi:hypothetical protein
MLIRLRSILLPIYSVILFVKIRYFGLETRLWTSRLTQLSGEPRQEVKSSHVTGDFSTALVNALRDPLILILIPIPSSPHPVTLAPYNISRGILSSIPDRAMYLQLHICHLD